MKSKEACRKPILFLSHASFLTICSLNYTLLSILSSIDNIHLRFPAAIEFYQFSSQSFAIAPTTK